MEKTLTEIKTKKVKKTKKQEKYEADVTDTVKSTDIEVSNISDAESIVLPDKNWEANIDINANLEQKIKPDEYVITPIAIYKKSTYTEASRLAQQKYREKYPEKYCELQKKVYNDNKANEEWRKHFNERSAKNNKIWRDKRNAEIIANGGTIRPKGRPKKVVIPVGELSNNVVVVEPPPVGELSNNVVVVEAAVDSPTTVIVEELPKKRGRPKTPNSVAEVPIQNLEPHTEMSIKENEPKVIIDTIIKHIKNKKPLKISN